MHLYRHAYIFFRCRYRYLSSSGGTRDESKVCHTNINAERERERRPKKNKQTKKKREKKKPPPIGPSTWNHSGIIEFEIDLSVFFFLRERSSKTTRSSNSNPFISSFLHPLTNKLSFYMTVAVDATWFDTQTDMNISTHRPIYYLPPWVRYTYIYISKHVDLFFRISDHFFIFLIFFLMALGF